ncbi:hypothetical protein Hanom_Chr00s000001g01595291 [Helianthus anomalus]
MLKRSSRLGPSRSMAMALYSPSTPNHLRLGTPASFKEKEWSCHF